MAGKQKEQRKVVSLLLTGVAVINKVVFPPASLVGKPSMGALMEGRFERLCGLEEPLKRGMRIGKSCRLGLCATTHVQPLCVHWRDTHDVFRYGGVRV